jgi:segregation and condensation protein A
LPGESAQGEAVLRPLELDLEVYQGPFDLLLSLVLREEVDLLEVPLFEVITAYLDEMEDAGVSGYWDEMTEFLLLMSLLVEVKSRLLLPRTITDLEGELSPEEARDQLLACLFEYSKYKAASVKLRELAETGSASLLRKPAGQTRRRLAAVEVIAGTEDALQLREHVLRLIEVKRPPDASHIAMITVELRRQVRIIRGILARHRRFSFNNTFGGQPPLVQALSLFALLDLLARGEIRVSQHQTFGDMLVTAREPKPHEKTA